MLPDVSHKKVLFVGESIIDVYHYGKLLGRPLKEPVLCIEWINTEYFPGGVKAAAEHAKDFVASVEVFSTREVRKDRYLEASHNRKLFEVYQSNKETPNEWPALTHDVVIVTDYGHGMLRENIELNWLKEAKYLAVNVQTNAGNYGFNLASKYEYVDYLCVDEPEARLATHNQDGNIVDSLHALAERASKVVITLGKRGAIGMSNDFREKYGVVTMPAITDRVVDTMGAGDAFFAVTACMAKETPIAELLKIGNAAGALKAQSLGQKPITKNELLEYLNR